MALEHRKFLTFYFHILGAFDQLHDQWNLPNVIEFQLKDF